MIIILFSVVVQAALPHFLLIVMWLHYLSIEVITVHLLSLLPVSDRSSPRPSS